MRGPRFLLSAGVLMLPLVALAAPGDADKGKPIYAAQCTTCHGKTGDGNGPVGRALNPRPKAFGKGGLSADDQMFKVIRKGGKAAACRRTWTPTRRSVTRRSGT